MTRKRHAHKKKQPRVSALVSAYFAEEYLEDRLENLYRQNPRPEIVLICTVNSAEAFIAAEFQEKYPDYPFLKIKTTTGVPTIYDAWNQAIELASGEYLTNANCDDRLYPGALAALMEALDDYPEFAVTYFDIDIVSEIGGLPINQFQWAEGDIEQLLRGCFLGPMPMWRASLHEKHGLFDAEMHSAGDYEFWLRIAKSGEMFYHIKKALGAYLSRSDNTNVEHREPLRSIWEQANAKARYRHGVGIWVEPEPMAKE